MNRALANEKTIKNKKYRSGGNYGRERSPGRGGYDRGMPGIENTYILGTHIYRTHSSGG